MLIYNPRINSLYKYTINSKMPFYTKNYKINKKEFPKTVLKIYQIFTSILII